MNSFSKFFKFGFVFIAIISLALVAGCKDDDDDPDPVQPTASFQYEIDGDNFLMVTFTNFSQNATSYSWAFGDGETSTDKDPVHTYAAAGEYTVELTATNDEGSKSKSETFTLTDPNAAGKLLTGETSKTWYLQREGVALGIGPAINDNSWWGFGAATPLGDRPCILDDSYTFHADGTFEFDSDGTIFVDSPTNGGWIDGADEGCHDETEPGLWTAIDGSDVSDFANGGAYTFDYDPAVGTITLNGSGAYIGLAQKTGGDDDYHPMSTKTYTIFNFVEGDIADSLQMILGDDDGSVWNFYLVSYHDINDLPDVPTSLPTADFSYEATDLTVAFSNTSNAAAVNFSWEFGDGNTSTEENPTHIYAAAGDYDVKLDTDDGQGNMATVTKTVAVGVSIPAPTSMGHTFVDSTGADLLSHIEGASTIDLGVDDPADANAPKVGQFNRVAGTPYQELILAFEPPSDIDFANLTNVSIEVYLPSGNDYANGLTKNVIVGLGDFLVNPSGNWWEDHAHPVRESPLFP